MPTVVLAGSGGYAKRDFQGANSRKATKRTRDIRESVCGCNQETRTSARQANFRAARTGGRDLVFARPNHNSQASIIRYSLSHDCLSFLLHVACLPPVKSRRKGNRPLS